jgi:hypothetical protein
VSSPDAVRIRRLAFYTTAGLYVQILFGTLVTHRSSRLDAHLFVAALLSVAVIILGFRIRAGRDSWPELLRPIEALGALWLVQMLLGVGVYVGKFHAADIAIGPSLAVGLPVSHRLVGGLMLIVAVVLTLRACRQTGWPEPMVGSQPATGKATA